jgi:hypothetical protein
MAVACSIRYRSTRITTTLRAVVPNTDGSRLNHLKEASYGKPLAQEIPYGS